MVSSDPGIDEPLAEWHWFESSKPTFLHRDALGSITAVTGTGAALLYRQAYKAFGERATGTPPSGITPTRLSYTGRENSLGSLYQYRSRYYDSSLGRFLSQDGYQGSATSPPSLHRYTYTHNNPVRYTDPSGNDIVPYPASWDSYISRAFAVIFVLVGYLAVAGIGNNPGVNIIARVMAKFWWEIRAAIVLLGSALGILRLIEAEIAGKMSELAVVFTIIVAAMMTSGTLLLNGWMLETVAGLQPRVSGVLLLGMLWSVQVSLVMWVIGQSIIVSYDF
jgi:RHS repeat-associated protein